MTATPFDATKTALYFPAASLIGRSFSFCIADILRQGIDPAAVAQILCGFHEPTDAVAWERVYEYNRSYYWQNEPDYGEAIGRYLYAQGRLDFNCDGRNGYYNLNDGLWLDAASGDLLTTQRANDLLRIGKEKL